MRPWSLGVLATSLMAMPAAAQETPAGDVLSGGGSGAMGTMDASVVPVGPAPLIDAPGVDLPAACRDGVADASQQRSSSSYGPAIPESAKPKEQQNPCLAPEFRPRAESEVLYEQQRVFERDPQDDANRATPDPCVWRDGGTRCSVSVDVSRGSAERNRRTPFD